MLFCMLGLWKHISTPRNTTTWGVPARMPSLSYGNPRLSPFLDLGECRRCHFPWDHFPHGGRSSNAWSNIFVGGQVRALDEKMKRWRGKSPCIRTVQSKAEPIGHWTCQLCARCHASGLPICIEVYPLKQKVCNSVNWAANLHNEFSPSLYFSGRFILFWLCISSRSPFDESMILVFKNLRNSFGRACEATWPVVWEILSAAREIIVRHKAETPWVCQDGYVERLQSGQTCKATSNRPPAWQENKFSFSVCDEYNFTMKGSTYPLRRGKWECNLMICFYIFTNQHGKCMEDSWYRWNGGD